MLCTRKLAIRLPSANHVYQQQKKSLVVAVNVVDTLRHYRHQHIPERKYTFHRGLNTSSKNILRRTYSSFQNSKTNDNTIQDINKEAYSVPFSMLSSRWKTDYPNEDSEELNSWCVKLANMGLISQSIRCFGEILARGQTPDTSTYAKMLNLCYVHKDPELGQIFIKDFLENVRTQNEMQHEKSDKGVCFISDEIVKNIIEIELLNKGPDHAIHKIQGLRKSFGFELNIDHYNIIFESYIRRKEYFQGQRMFQYMVNHGIVPNARTWTLYFRSNTVQPGGPLERLAWEKYLETTYLPSPEVLSQYALNLARYDIETAVKLLRHHVDILMPMVDLSKNQARGDVNDGIDNINDCKLTFPELKAALFPNATVFAQLLVISRKFLLMGKYDNIVIGYEIMKMIEISGVQSAELVLAMAAFQNVYFHTESHHFGLVHQKAIKYFEKLDLTDLVCLYSLNDTFSIHLDTLSKRTEDDRKGTYSLTHANESFKKLEEAMIVGNKMSWNNYFKCRIKFGQSLGNVFDCIDNCLMTMEKLSNYGVYLSPIAYRQVCEIGLEASSDTPANLERLQQQMSRLTKLLSNYSITEVNPGITWLQALYKTELYDDLVNVVIHMNKQKLPIEEDVILVYSQTLSKLTKPSSEALKLFDRLMESLEILTIQNGDFLTSILMTYCVIDKETHALAVYQHWCNHRTVSTKSMTALLEFSSEKDYLRIFDLLLRDVDKKGIDLPITTACAVASFFIRNGFVEESRSRFQYILNLNEDSWNIIEQNKQIRSVVSSTLRLGVNSYIENKLLKEATSIMRFSFKVEVPYTLEEYQAYVVKLVEYFQYKDVESDYFATHSFQDLDMDEATLQKLAYEIITKAMKTYNDPYITEVYNLFQD